MPSPGYPNGSAGTRQSWRQRHDRWVTTFQICRVFFPAVADPYRVLYKFGMRFAVTACELEQLIHSAMTELLFLMNKGERSVQRGFQCQHHECTKLQFFLDCRE